MDWNNCTQTVTVNTSNGSPNPTVMPTTEHVATVGCLVPFLQSLISAAFMFAGVTAAIVIIIAGIKYVRSRGDPKNLQSAQQTLTWGIIGLVIVILAFGIVTFIGWVTGTSNSCIFQGLFSGKLPVNGTINVNGNVVTNPNPCQ